MKSQHNLQLYPALRAVIPFAAGIAVANRLWPLWEMTDGAVENGPSIVCLYGVSALLVGAMFVGFLRRDMWHSPRWFGGAAVLFFFVLGMLRFALQREGVQTDWPDGAIQAKGVLTDVPKRSGRVITFNILVYARLESTGEWMPWRRGVQLRLPYTAAAGNLSPGSGLVFRAVLSPPANRGNPDEFDYRGYMLRNGITGTAFVPETQWAGRGPEITDRNQIPLWTRLRVWALKIRARLLGVYAEAGLQGDELAVVSALTLGDRAALSAELRQTYADAGVSHVLALSGLHLGILVGLFQLLLLRWVRFRRIYRPLCAVVIAFVWGYALLAGLPASLVRAAIMYTLMLVGSWAGRSAFSLQSLAISGFVMLLFRPFYLFDIGFQLSFVAMLGILLLSKPLADMGLPLRGGLRSLWRTFAVGLSAQWATAPLVAYYFHTFSAYSSLLTLCISPFTTLLVGASPLLLLFRQWGWESTWLVSVLTYAVRWQNTFLSASRDWPGALCSGLYPSVGTVLLWLALLAGLAFRPYVQSRTWLRGMALCACLLAGVTMYSHRARYVVEPHIWFYNHPRQPAVHLVYNAGESYLLMPPADSLDAGIGSLGRYWERTLCSPPVVVADSLLSVAPLEFRNGVLFAPRIQLVQVYDTSWRHVRVETPLAVDYLHVCRGFRGKLCTLSAVFAPSLVVLDASLGENYSRSYVEECRSLGWPVHDMRAQGALKVAFK